MNDQNNPNTEPLYRPTTSRQAICFINWRCRQRLFPNDNKEVGCDACGFKKIPQNYVMKELSGLFLKDVVHNQQAN